MQQRAACNVQFTPYSIKHTLSNPRQPTLRIAFTRAGDSWHGISQSVQHYCYMNDLSHSSCTAAVASQAQSADLQQLLHGIPLAPRHAELLHLEGSAEVRRIIEHACVQPIVEEPPDGSHGTAPSE